MHSYCVVFRLSLVTFSHALFNRAVSLNNLVDRKYLHLKNHPFLSGDGDQAKDVLFLFNGMEKMQVDFKIGSSELCNNPNEPLPPSVIIVNLLRKYLLPEVSHCCFLALGFLFFSYPT